MSTGNTGGVGGAASTDALWELCWEHGAVREGVIQAMLWLGLQRALRLGSHQ